MPTYDYYCTSCKKTLEIMHKITDQPLKMCKDCQRETLVRKPSFGSSLSITGDGFYSTMYKKEESPPSTPTSKPMSSCCPCGSSGVKGNCQKS